MQKKKKNAKWEKKICLKKSTNSDFMLFLGMREYCSTDTFDVTCGDNEAIMMQSAIYGRMQAGRCISGKDIYNLSFPLEWGLTSLWPFV